MKKLLLLLLTYSIIGTGAALAQKIKVTEGDISVLKGQKTLNAVYVYTDMGVGDYAKEADYVKKKTDEYNKKEKGKGDDWATKWEGARKNEYEPKFEELYSKYHADLGNHPDAKYTLIIHTSWTEPGYNVYVTRKNAMVSGDVSVVETANQSKVLCKIKFEKAPGRTFGGNDFDSGTRISEAYAKAGKEISQFVMDKTKK